MNIRAHECLRCGERWEAPVRLSRHIIKKGCPHGCKTGLMSSAVYKRKLKFTFTTEIQAHSRREIIDELTFFIEQIAAEADGGGTDDEDLKSIWCLKKCE